MPPRSARPILHGLALLIGVLSIGDRGLHRLTGAEHGPSHAEADGACPLCRLAAEPVATADIIRPLPFDLTVARAEAVPPTADRPGDPRDAAAPRAPPASA